MTLLDEALHYLNRDPLRHMDMLQPIQRGTAEIVAADEGGVLLRETASGGYFLSARTPEAALALLNRIDQAGLMALHQDYFLDEAALRFGLEPTMRCHQAAWLRAEPPEAPPSALAIRPLTLDRAEEVQSLYSHDIGLPFIKGRLSAGEMFGAFREGELAGFIGLHEEGSMGMLEVVPSFRRMGVGSRLVAFLCRRLMERGLIPYSQFTVDNIRSRTLHEKMGFGISEELVYWLEPPRAQA